ncbi:MAG TPA: hypothetical protein VN026_02255 [Bacteroidia bacterium]|jgi:stalled ribosome rescue protein Dom34|nr:hypothetical protein [Bacteroidia bacterium]
MLSCLLAAYSYPLTNIAGYIAKTNSSLSKKNNMTTKKQIGIWMDHSAAHLMELTNDVITTNIIESEFTHKVKEDSLNKSENLMHNKEQHLQHSYYKKIGEAIKDHQQVVLFGPTDAKTELFNLLKEDHHFENIEIDVEDTDKMTENQQHAFVKAHFQA